MSRDESSGIDAVIGVAIALLVLAPLGALLSTWGATTLWRWYVEPQYGAGPTAQTWYGLSLLLGMMMFGPLANVQRTKSESSNSLTARVIGGAVVHALAVLVVLGGAWVVKAIAFS